MQQYKTEEGEGDPRTNSGEAAGLGASAHASEAPGTQPQSNPARAPSEIATQQTDARPPASPDGASGAQPQSNPASAPPENGNQQAVAETVPLAGAAATSEAQVNSVSTETAVPESQRIPVDRIDPFPYQFRQTFDEEKLRELSESIRQIGLKQPILVRPVVDRFQVVSGERRLRAAKLLGWTSISAVVQDLSNLDAAIGGLVENVQREDLTPIERACAFKQLNDPPFELSQREIARRIRLDQSVIVRTMELLKQPEQIQELLSRAALSPTHVRALKAVKSHSKRAELAAQAAREHWSVEETQKQAHKSGKSEKAQAKGSDHESDKGDLPGWDWLHRLLEILRALTLLRRLGRWLLAFAVRLIPRGEGFSRVGFIPPARDITEPPKDDAPEHPTPPGTKIGTR